MHARLRAACTPATIELALHASRAVGSPVASPALVADMHNMQLSL